ncbi:hypothetical protein KI659_11350 [Litoribacter alkaliphilus]|uniref:Uncharacterized protein n=1 Tax=Litoribacter ruber TaxID=702568 RepID=A0AAP2CJY9_9BACT|nr:hypothetical protein [Litoribacter alkaliphilus]MBS9524606.1 hypothetical protein [Litoribacter alkaliphilus]
MRTTFLFSLLLVISTGLFAQKIPSAESQIKTAVLAAPEEFREGAKVYGYDTNGEWTVLREGNNEMVCIASDPKRDGFSASCYHKELEPFMERGRELTREGKSFEEIFETREKEVKEGKLQMPKDGVTLFVLSADKEDYDPEKGAVQNTNFRYVVYIPYATVESTGLPLKPQAPGMPWIMDPGTHRAHIMITPPPKNKD